jgi:hypothetical protein
VCNDRTHDWVEVEMPIGVSVGVSPPSVDDVEEVVSVVEVPVASVFPVFVSVVELDLSSQPLWWGGHGQTWTPHRRITTHKTK